MRANIEDDDVNDDFDDEKDDESDYKAKKIRRKLERLTHACRSNNLGGPFGGGGGGGCDGYSRYELRRIWPYKESEISFEKTTSLFAESAMMMREKTPHQAGRKVDVEKLMENVEKYFLSEEEKKKTEEDHAREKESTPTRASTICARDVFDSEEMASMALVRRKGVEQQRLARTLQVELNKTRKEKNKVLEDMSNAREKNQECVKQVRDSMGMATKKATEMEEERDRYRYRCEKLEIEIRMLRNGERFELLREKMIVREKRLKEKLEDALKMVEVLKLECIEKDAELIRIRERRKNKY